MPASLGMTAKRRMIYLTNFNSKDTRIIHRAHVRLYVTLLQLTRRIRSSSEGSREVMRRSSAPVESDL